MSQYVDQIRKKLDHENFDNIHEFSQIAEEKNYSKEYNGVTLNEAIGDFEQTVEILDTAIEQKIINTLGISQQKNIQKKLDGVRKQANNLGNKNSRRNNSGKNFIKQVDDLHGYVIGDLSLDLRAGEHLDFSEQLTKLEEIRREHQKTLQNLEQAEVTYREIEEFHEDIEKQNAGIDDIVASAEELEGELEETKTDVENIKQDVIKEAQTVNERYEDVLEKKKEIDNYEERLSDNLDETEKRSERLTKQKKDLNDIEEKINTLLNGAVTANLGTNFTERKEELETSAKWWAGFTFVAIAVLIGGAFFIFESITQSGDFGAGTISRVTLLIPLLVAVWFTSKNYSRKRRLTEEYAFKSTMAKTVEPSRKVLESQESLDETDDQLAKFMLVSMGQMFTNPSDIVENGSTTTKDADATNLQTVLDYANRITNKD